MDNWQAGLSVGVFVTAVVLLMTDLLPMPIVGLAGALVLVFTNVISLATAMEYVGRNHTTLALFFGVMVMVRSFAPTKIFAYLAAQMIRFSGGKGKNILLGIAISTGLFSSLLPNATTVLLLAPLLPPLAELIGVDFVPLLILMAIAANSGGLFTLIGDPVNFIVGDFLQMTFGQYLHQMAVSGILTMLVVVITLPFLFPVLWQSDFGSLAHLPVPPIHHRRTLVVGGVIVLLVVIFFAIGDSLASRITPPAVALLGATLCMLLSDLTGVDKVSHILRDVDWSTLIFFMSFFVLIGSLEATGVIGQIAGFLTPILGQNPGLSVLILLWVTGCLSSLVPNIPLVVAMVPLLNQYLVNVGSTAIENLPLFYAVIFGGSVGGSATLIGASANLVAAGVAEQYGRTLSFAKFLQLGLPIAVAQLLLGSLFLLSKL
ncbi:MAG: SLC13 family permease [Pseudanabaenaceae cyanobacterium SKYGB_i_bin29]|nr:SLC13 family permease [Pseudanabaenaceae cyanobacterium SKYG29]MDW8422207.1 SLC13 family permease [Pseudanabaenaceae cyanobacterium SKYGB_i_bin29]